MTVSKTKKQLLPPAGVVFISKNIKEIYGKNTLS